MFLGMQLSTWALLAIAVGLLINCVQRTIRPRFGRSSEKPKTSPEDYDDLFEDLSTGYLQIDSEGIVRGANQAECKIRGVSAQELTHGPPSADDHRTLNSWVRSSWDSRKHR